MTKTKKNFVLLVVILFVIKEKIIALVNQSKKTVLAIYTFLTTTIFNEK